MKSKSRESILWVEAIGFGSLTLFVWATEMLQISHFLFGEQVGINWLRLSLRTFMVLLVWVIVHLATRRLLARLRHLEEYLRVCAWCRRIGHRDEWMTMEDYFGSALDTKTTHGMCPECSARLKSHLPLPEAVAISRSTPEDSAKL